MSNDDDDDDDDDNDDDGNDYDDDGNEDSNDDDDGNTDDDDDDDDDDDGNNNDGVCLFCTSVLETLYLGLPVEVWKMAGIILVLVVFVVKFAVPWTVDYLDKKCAMVKQALE